MFKIPDWDVDTPNIEISSNKPKKKNKVNVSSGPRENGVKKPSFKTKNSKTIKNIKKSNVKESIVQAHVKNGQPNINVNKKKFNKQKPKKDKNNESLTTDTKSIITNKIDEDKLNELITIEKRRKVNKKQPKKIEHNVMNATNRITTNNEQLIKNNKSKAKRKKNKHKNITQVTTNEQTDKPTNSETNTSIASEQLSVTMPKTKKQKQNKKNQSPKKEFNKVEENTEDSDEELAEVTNKEVELIKNESNNDDMFAINADSFDSDKLDELIIKKKKEKLKKFDNNNIEEVLFTENSNSRKRKLSSSESNEDNMTNLKAKENRKKELLKSVLQKETHRNVINTSSSNTLRDRMLEKLKAAKFRYLNEKLYTSTGSEAQEIFKSDPDAFQTYHEGYQQQVKKWPVMPLDIIVKRIQKMPKSYKIADMGCGEAELSTRVSHAVRSFDLVASAPRVEACDVARTPLLAAEVHAAVYCLALMGTNLTQYLLEANRVLKMGGHLLIAEVESRFNNVDNFVRDVQKLGFSLKKLDKTHKVFFFMEFTKVRDPPAKKAKLPTLTLKPCIYKKR